MSQSVTSPKAPKIVCMFSFLGFARTCSSHARIVWPMNDIYHILVILQEYGMQTPRPPCANPVFSIILFF